MSLEINDVYSPVGECPQCGQSLLLEPLTDEDISMNVIAKCWACSYSHNLNLDFIETYVQKLYPNIQTWKIYNPKGNRGGVVITGNRLYTTTKEKEQLYIKLQDAENKKYNAINKKLEQIYGQEETILLYLEGYEIEQAYHYASKPHKCLITGTASAMKCKENVNWIINDVFPIIGEHFNLYSLILLAWNNICVEFDRGILNCNIKNETELRTYFLQKIKDIDPFENDYALWQDRYITIANEILKPDAQFQYQAVIEIKSFFREQKYTLEQAKRLIFGNIEKMRFYSKVFKVGFFLCLSDKFGESELRPESFPNQGFPFRMLIHSKVKSIDRH
ncbi:MAG: hypothetical protein HZB79_05750 [Deltaproteobacteria bacterium]|nr:hypothetical protein [Deltaproteobacteria bacterium]